MEPEMELVWENRLPRTYGVFVWLLVFSWSVVFAEPALYDLLFIALFLIGVLTSRLSFPKHTVLPAFLLLAFIEANLVSMFFAEADPYLAAKYFLITFYLALSWVFYCGFLNKYKRHALDLLLSGYLTSALFASAIGILAYLHVIPDFGLLIRFSGRLTGFFKDPNTFGSFLVPPVLLALSRMEGETRPARKTAWLGAFALLSAAVFQRYDLSRFATYRQAFLLSWSNPLGLGPAQSDIALGMSPHNLYLLVLLECGIVGALTAMWLIAGSVWRSFSAVFSRNSALAPYSAAIAASLLGLLVNSAFVDTLHWRHFWLLLALPWAANSGKKDSGKDGKEDDYDRALAYGR